MKIDEGGLGSIIDHKVQANPWPECIGYMDKLILEDDDMKNLGVVAALPFAKQWEADWTRTTIL